MDEEVLQVLQVSAGKIPENQCAIMHSPVPPFIDSPVSHSLFARISLLSLRAIIISRDSSLVSDSFNI